MPGGCTIGRGKDSRPVRGMPPDGHGPDRTDAPAVISPDDFVERRLDKVLRSPPSGRVAGSVIVFVTGMTVVVAGTLIRVFDSKEFHSFGDALWWALQTVTTVGYGDIVPKDLIGRIIGALVMLQGIAFITVVSAVITSIFVERAHRQRLGPPGPEPDDVHEAIRSVDERLRRIEERLERL